MIRYTTPTEKFIFFILENPSEYETILITFKQDEEIVLELTKDDLTFENNNAYCMLSQEQTALFKADRKLPILVQARYVTADGKAWATKEVVLGIYDVLNQGVI